MVARNDCRDQASANINEPAAASVPLGFAMHWFIKRNWLAKCEKNCPKSLPMAVIALVDKLKLTF